MGSIKYTPEILDRLKTMLESGATIRDMSEAVGFSECSLRAKLSSLGLYKKQPYLTKNGKPSYKKSELVDKIAELIGEPPELLESLEKCNKLVLELLIDNLT